MADEDLVHSYEACKSMAVSYRYVNLEENQIEHIKAKYKSIINSPRRYDEIKDLKELLKILEKRGKLHALDIHVLDDIYDLLGINKKILQSHNKFMRSFTNRAQDVDNQAPPKNTPFQDASSRYNISGHSQNGSPHEYANSNGHGLSERESSTSGNTPGSATSPDRPGVQNRENIFPIPLLTLCNETVIRLSRGLHTDGNKSIENCARSTKIQEKNPNAIFVDRICISATLIFITILFSALILYKAYELILSINDICWLIYHLTLVWLLIYFFLFVGLHLIIISHSFCKSLLWFIEDSREKGVTITLLYCVRVLFEEVKSWFQRNKIEEEEEKPPHDIDFISVGKTMFNCVVWFAKSLYNKGMINTMHCCIKNCLQKIKVGIEYWLEPKFESGTFDENYEKLSSESIVSIMASKLSKILINLFDAFGVFLLYYSLFLFVYHRVKNWLMEVVHD